MRCIACVAAKQGGRKLLAIADEEGQVRVLNTENPTQEYSFQPHNNAIFDVRWSPDDRQIVSLLRHSTCTVERRR